MALRPGDSCLALPPYISSSLSRQSFAAQISPLRSTKFGHGHQLIPQVYVEYDGEVYAVEAEAITPIDSAS
jgi:hypothetical protein